MATAATGHRSRIPIGWYAGISTRDKADPPLLSTATAADELRLTAQIRSSREPGGDSD